MIKGFMEMTSTLIDRLNECATLWVDATGGTLARLGREVVNDGGYFARIGDTGASTTTATLEKFARYLGDPANWPAGKDGGGCVPEQITAFAHVTGVTAPATPVATGQIGELSGERAA